jgi:ParB/RepB/Spo0J family partition protein
MAKAAKKAAVKLPFTKGPAMKLTEFTAANLNDTITATGAKKSGKLLLVPIDKIHVVPGFNLRVTDTPDYLKGIEELAESITMEGFYPSKPISGYAADLDGETVIALIDGHRRYAAALMAVDKGADIETLPVVLKDPKVTDLDLAVSLHKENASVPLTMLERAVLAHRMLRSGETEEDVAARLQVSTRHVSDLKVLIGAPRAIRDLIKEGKLSPSEAVKQLRIDPTGEKLLAAAEKIEKAAAEKLTKGPKDSKLTKQSIDDDGSPKVKMQISRLNFKATEGATFLFEDAEPFLGLLGEEWFKNAKKKAERIALENVEIEVKIRRPKTAEEVEAEAEVATTKADTAAAKKAAAKADAAPVKQTAKAGGHRKAPSDLDADDMGSEDDDLSGGVPNLRELGIAEPAGSEL